VAEKRGKTAGKRRTKGDTFSLEVEQFSSQLCTIFGVTPIAAFSFA